VAPSGELRGKGRCGVFAGKTLWSTPERLRGEVLTTRRFTNLCLPLPLRGAQDVRGSYYLASLLTLTPDIPFWSLLTPTEVKRLVASVCDSACLFLCLSVRSITQKRMNPKCSNLVHVIVLGCHTTNGMILIWGLKGQRLRSQRQCVT